MAEPHESLPKTLPVLALKDTVLLPGLTLPLSVTHDISQAAVEAAAAGEVKHLAVVAVADDSGVLFLGPGARVGTEAVIKRLTRPRGRMEIVLQGIERTRLRVHEQNRFPIGLCTPQPIAPSPDPSIDALHRSILDGADRIQKLLRRQAGMTLSDRLRAIPNRAHQVYFVASILNLLPAQEQAVLEANTEKDLMAQVNGLVSREIEVLRMRQKIAKRADEAMDREEREHWLRHQLRAIQDQLGDSTPQQSDLQLLRAAVSQLPLADSVREEVTRELGNLERLSFQSPEYSLLRAYLGFITELPWGRATQDPEDLESVAASLDRDHFDLKDVKERILEHAAVLKLNPRARAPVLCFVGPPGVGKTSLAESIARALGRKLARISLGGIHDESELRGHRRTYLGAMPGKILQAIRRAGASNPLLILDEIDKVGKDFRGDPAAALLEILDPSQNRAFQDNYLNLPFDLSSVFFIATANRTDTIPDPLFDRLEILRLAGYVDEEKREIARRFLVPKQLDDAGLSSDRFEVTDEGLEMLIRDFTREAGVRQLNRLLGRLVRRSAHAFALRKNERILVTPEFISSTLVKYRYHRECRRSELPAGVATGLAWTEVGGELLYIETVQLPGGRNMILTGHLGKVMRESAETALSCVISKGDWLGINPKLAMDTTIHMHVPSGSIPKDGPSAGVAMAVAIASLLSGLSVESGVAMTGEVTLGGNVLPVGGIKEKVLAAKRENIRCVVLPAPNEKDLADISPNTLKGMEFCFVTRIEEALRLAIPALQERLDAHSSLSAGAPELLPEVTESAALPSEPSPDLSATDRSDTP